jgi:AcrR family transcriptional regulator
MIALMAMPREFDREEALERATAAFWAKGYASTSTDDLLTAMGIGRQSLYNTFGDKRALYLEALERYQRTSIAGHLQRLNGAASSIAGVSATKTIFVRLAAWGSVPSANSARQIPRLRRFAPKSLQRSAAD